MNTALKYDPNEDHDCHAGPESSCPCQVLEETHFYCEDCAKWLDTDYFGYSDDGDSFCQKCTERQERETESYNRMIESQYWGSR